MSRFGDDNMLRQVTPAELRAQFPAGSGWRIREVSTVDFLSSVAPPVPATCACVERLG